ncbi:hypothetical protein GCM10009823_00810 [Brevibacterium salitolerans]|uniref:Uncharacterized protein n=1 Tax=Brevibacterium salitolerans TaxID=1403566 RepID=A0ABN2W8Y9_9MICO
MDDGEEDAVDRTHQEQREERPPDAEEEHCGHPHEDGDVHEERIQRCALLEDVQVMEDHTGCAQERQAEDEEDESPSSWAGGCGVWVAGCGLRADRAAF